MCEVQRTLSFVNGVCEFNVNTIQRNLLVHFSMTTESVTSMWIIMRWMLFVSASYNLSRRQTFKPCDVNGWRFEILPSLETLRYIFSVSADDDDDDDDDDDYDDDNDEMMMLMIPTMTMVMLVIVYFENEEDSSGDYFDNGVCDFIANSNQRNRTVLISKIIIS